MICISWLPGIIVQFIPNRLDLKVTRWRYTFVLYRIYFKSRWLYHVQYCFKFFGDTRDASNQIKNKSKNQSNFKWDYFDWYWWEFNWVNYMFFDNGMIGQWLFFCLSSYLNVNSCLHIRWETAFLFRSQKKKNWSFFVYKFTIHLLFFFFNQKHID